MKIQAIILGAFCLALTIFSMFWKNTLVAYQWPIRNYQELRMAYAFRGFPMDDFIKQINLYLPNQTPIALGDNIKGNDFLKQRISEAIYPRPIDKQSKYTVDLIDSNRFNPSLGPVLMKLGNEILLVLISSDPLTQQLSQPATESFDFAPLSFLVGFLALLGLGGLIKTAVQRWYPLTNRYPLTYSILWGTVLISLITTLSTMFQIGLPYFAIKFLGLLAFGYLVFKNRAELNLSQLKNRFKLSIETVLLGFLLLVFNLKLILFPITLWDGRSVWFFQAKRIFFQHMFSLKDLLSVDNYWSNPMYPLFFSSLASYFSSLNHLYNERMASLAIAVLFSTLMYLTYQVIKLVLPRWISLIFIIASFMMFEPLVAGGYVDAYLSILLLLQILSLFHTTVKNHHPSLALMAGFICSMLKREGLLFSLLIFLSYHFLFSTKKLTNLKSKIASFAIYIPALVYAIWTKAIGLNDIFHESKWLENLNDFFWRTQTIIEINIGQTLKQPILLIGFIALIILTVAYFMNRTNYSDLTKKLIYFGIIFYLSSFLALFNTSLDLKWHVATAMDRLMFHSSFLYLFGLHYFFSRTKS